MKRIYILLVIAIGVIYDGFGQQQVTLSLSEAIEYAKSNSAVLKNAKLAIDDSKQVVKSVKSMGLPQVNAVANFTHNLQIPSQVMPDFISPAVYGVLIQEGLLTPDKFKFGDPQTLQFGSPSSLIGMANLNQLLFDGSFFLGLKAAKEYIMVSELLAENTEIRLIETITKSYYASLLANRNIKLLNTSLITLTKTLDDTKKLYKAGLVEKLDVDRMTFAETNLKAQLANLEFQAKIILGALKINMGMPIKTSLSLTDLMVFKLQNTEEDINIDNRSEIKLLKQQLVLDSMNIRRYKLQYMPSLTLNATYQQNSFATVAEFEGLGKEWNPGFYYGINLNIPIFDGFNKKAKIGQAKIKYEQDKNTLEQTKNALLFEVEQAGLNVEIQKNNVEAQRANRTLAQEIYRTTKVKYDEGLASSFELIQAESDKNQAEITLSTALYQYIVAQIDQLKATSTLK